jgi:hypothetical protein
MNELERDTARGECGKGRVDGGQIVPAKKISVRRIAATLVVRWWLEVTMVDGQGGGSGWSRWSAEANQSGEKNQRATNLRNLDEVVVGGDDGRDGR